jgi:cell fate regulator YaaT (PSP1 superfamily)
MNKIAEISFKFRRKEYYQYTEDIKILPGKYVIVEADRGVDLGKVARLTNPEERCADTDDLKEIIRLATREDIESLAHIRAKEEQAKVKFEKALLDQPFQMDLVDVEYQFDGNRLTFYFMADARIDFRDFLKILAKIFHTRIELRQISPYQEIERLGGIGPCGRELCCKALRWKSPPVTPEMLKHQNLTVTTSKVTGACGHLLCCLAYEASFYEKAAEYFPNLNESVMYQGKEMRVVKNDYLTFTVVLEDENSINHSLTLEQFNRIKLEKNEESRRSHHKGESASDGKVERGRHHRRKKKGRMDNGY